MSKPTNTYIQFYIHSCMHTSVYIRRKRTKNKGQKIKEKKTWQLFQNNHMDHTNQVIRDSNCWNEVWAGLPYIQKPSHRGLYMQLILILCILNFVKSQWRASGIRAMCEQSSCCILQPSEDRLRTERQMWKVSYNNQDRRKLKLLGANKSFAMDEL